MAFTEGQTIIRVIEGRGAPIGHKYHVILYDFNGNGKKQLVADGGYIKELITPEREKEYAVEESIENLK